MRDPAFSGTYVIQYSALKSLGKAPPSWHDSCRGEGGICNPTIMLSILAWRGVCRCCVITTCYCVNFTWHGSCRCVKTAGTVPASPCNIYTGTLLACYDINVGATMPHFFGTNLQVHIIIALFHFRYDIGVVCAILAYGNFS